MFRYSEILVQCLAAGTLGTVHTIKDSKLHLEIGCLKASAKQWSSHQVFWTTGKKIISTAEMLWTVDCWLIHVQTDSFIQSWLDLEPLRLLRLIFVKCRRLLLNRLRCQQIVGPVLDNLHQFWCNTNRFCCFAEKTCLNRGSNWFFWSLAFQCTKALYLLYNVTSDANHWQSLCLHWHMASIQPFECTFNWQR